MTRKPLFAAVALISLVLVGAASADRRSFGASTSNYTSNGKFGIGIELGAPAGVNGKFFLSPNRALNFGIGWLYDTYYRDGAGLHLNRAAQLLHLKRTTLVEKIKRLHR